MQRTARRLTRMAAFTLLLLIASLGSKGRISGQQAAFVTMPETSSDTALDRITRIERKMRRLKAANERLQASYDDLTRQYQALLQQAANPLFTARQANWDGQGVPGGASFRLASFLQQERQSSKKTSGPPTGEGEAGEEYRDESGGSQRTGEVEESGEQEEEPFQPVEIGLRLSPAQASPRVQAGVSGAGERLEIYPAATMESYLKRRGPYEPDMRPARQLVEVYFGEGLEVRSADEFFTLEFHNLTQLDYRAFDQTGDALHDNFIIPRQRWYFQGELTPYAYYYTVIDRGYGTIDILDSFMDLSLAPKYKRQMQLRAGRMKTPFTYEYIKVSESDLIAAERSLFITNFAGNREEGAMLHGQVLANSMEYYVGAFNGQRRSFQSFNNSKNLFCFVNTKPFLHSGIEWLENLNIAGSVFGGDQRNPIHPVNLVTANDQAAPGGVPGTLNVSPTFLIYNSNAFENGPRMQWAADVAYYYKSFTMLANYDGGFQDYSLQGPGALPSAAVYQPFSTDAFVGVGASQRTRVPLTGWSVACTYFVTGEQITRRVYLTEPRRPFGWYNGRLNPGAIEIYSRFANLQVGDQVFTGGFANPAYWANRANAIDTGVNWYWNHYVRMYFDWQHSMFNQPVFLSDTKSTKHEDLYWFRTQIFF
jgi:phosphate-selective porin OprO/OprP